MEWQIEKISKVGRGIWKHSPALYFIQHGRERNIAYVDHGQARVHRATRRHTIIIIKTIEHKAAWCEQARMDPRPDKLPPFPVHQIIAKARVSDLLGTLVGDGRWSGDGRRVIFIN